jgi:hypothetical protein
VAHAVQLVALVAAALLELLDFVGEGVVVRGAGGELGLGDLGDGGVGGEGWAGREGVAALRGELLDGGEGLWL